MVRGGRIALRGQPRLTQVDLCVRVRQTERRQGVVVDDADLRRVGVERPELLGAAEDVGQVGRVGVRDRAVDGERPTGCDRGHRYRDGAGHDHRGSQEHRGLVSDACSSRGVQSHVWFTPLPRVDSLLWTSCVPSARSVLSGKPPSMAGVIRGSTGLRGQALFAATPHDAAVDPTG